MGSHQKVSIQIIHTNYQNYLCYCAGNHVPLLFVPDRLSILKFFFLCAQLCLFASFRDSHVFYARNTEVVFSHLFLQEWDVTREAPPYPPAAGPLAVYSKKQFHEYLDFAIVNVS